MQNFLASSIAGLLLGLIFYGCVRLRMYVGPLLRERFGNWARKTYWILTILLMIVLANVALATLRDYLTSGAAPENMLLHEIWFTLLAVALAGGLIYRRMARNR